MFKRGLLISSLIILLTAGSFEIRAQNKKADGYNGLWSSSVKSDEFGYKYSGGLGTYSPNHNPVSVYSAKAKKTFFVYGGTRAPEESHLQIMVSYFDHRSHKVPKPVIVCDKKGVSDARDNASISIDSGGYLWIFVSGMGRTRPGLIFRSTLPYSIDSFDTIKEWEMLFPQPWYIKDTCFMLMYSRVLRGRELYWSLSTDGGTWTKGEKLAAMGGHNQVTNVKGNRIVSVFNYFPDRNIDKQTNIYLLQTDDLGKTWRTIDGKVVQTPVTDVHNEALIRDFESENKLVYIKDLNFDSHGSPVILAIISHDFRPGPGGDPREWIIIHRKADKWIFSKVCDSDHNHDMGSLYISDDDWRIIGSTEPGPGNYGTGGEIALWISTDEGETWEKDSDITSNSKKNNTYPRRPLNASERFYSFWSDGDAENLSESHLYFTDKNCSKVWVLPYNMKKDLERPERIKQVSGK